MVKYIAFHLPQYHSFKENDEWWGPGFTDWENVKKALPLYSGHDQPRIPLGNNYYDMLDPNVHKWQAETAKKYGVSGFCYYHYYFNGKLLMEKPLEMILKEKDVDLPFCMCWANEPWDGKTSTVLMPQEYGNEEDWQRHIDYLLPFFSDERYIKVNGAPLFVIYRTNNIPRVNEMVEYYKSACRKAGFPDLYVCEEMNSFQSAPVCANSDAVISFEPTNVQRDRSKVSAVINRLTSALYTKKPKAGIKIFDYNKVWKKILNQKKVEGKKQFYGAFVGWDNTPRRKVKGTVYKNVSPVTFEKNLHLLAQRAANEGSEYIFINAWNEWAEGAYLEPDQKNGYAYLEALGKTLES